MNSYMKSFFIILGFFLVFSGLNTVSYKSDIFATSLTLSCGNSGCENTVNHTCISTALAQTKILCNSISVTCKRCVDLTLNGCICDDGSTFCKNPNGTYYYGEQVTCDVD